MDILILQDILTSHGALLPDVGSFHLAWPFSPCVDFFTSLEAFSPCMEHFHLTFAFSPCVNILTSCGAFSPQVGHFHLVRDSHFACTLQERHAMCAPLYYHHHYISHLTSTLPWHQTFNLACSPPHENNIFHLMWNNYQNIDKATPIPSISHLL